MYKHHEDMMMMMMVFKNKDKRKQAVLGSCGWDIHKQSLTSLAFYSSYINLSSSFFTTHSPTSL